MQQFKASLLAATGLLIVGCSSTPKSDDVALSSAADPETTTEPLTPKAADQKRIMKSLRTMDGDVDRALAQEDMKWLRENGLYDPNNKNPLIVGEPAPDFELMPLKFYDFQIGRGVTKENAGMLFEPVRLSDFEGNLPVVLIFGSYT